MVILWYTKIKLGQSELADVPARYHDDVLAKLVKDGLYNTDGEKNK